MCVHERLVVTTACVHVKDTWSDGRIVQYIQEEVGRDVRRRQLAPPCAFSKSGTPHRARRLTPASANWPSCAMEKKPWTKDAVVGAPGAKVPPESAAPSVTALARPAARGPLFHA